MAVKVIGFSMLSVTLLLALNMSENLPLERQALLDLLTTSSAAFFVFLRRVGIVIRAGLKFLSLLKPTGQAMHQQFNIQQLYALPTLYLCVLYLSENKQRLLLLTA